SRAEDRPDLLKLERELKAQGMDVDVQRYYLIQVPLRRDAKDVRLSNMGTPPWQGASYNETATGGVTGGAVPPPFSMPPPPAPTAAAGAPMAPPATMVPQITPPAEEKAKRDVAGLARVAIGHG